MGYDHGETLAKAGSRSDPQGQVVLPRALCVCRHRGKGTARSDPAVRRVATDEQKATRAKRGAGYSFRGANPLQGNDDRSICDKGESTFAVVDAGGDQTQTWGYRS